MEIDPNRTAVLFPGQGSQQVGMGRELAASESAARRIFHQADELLGYSISTLCWEGPEEKLDDTEFTQPALLTHSIAVLEVLKSRLPGFGFKLAAGHSLGEFSALVGCGALTFRDGLALVKTRGTLMKSAGEDSPGGMAAVLGMDLDSVDRVCALAAEQAGGHVVVANDNCPGQVVISGEDFALTEAIRLLKQEGARKVVRLAVSIPAHSPLMAPIEAEFRHAIESTSFHDPDPPVYGNVQAKPLRLAREARADLAAQLTSRVRWTESMLRMRAAGIETFIEVGSGTVLSGLLRRIDREADAISVKTLADLQGLLN
jgi:[acyl-carrier-protein] S-malonyltransferase